MIHNGLADAVIIRLIALQVVENHILDFLVLMPGLIIRLDDTGKHLSLFAIFRISLHCERISCTTAVSANDNILAIITRNNLQRRLNATLGDIFNQGIQIRDIVNIFFGGRRMHLVGRDPDNLFGTNRHGTTCIIQQGSIIGVQRLL